MQTTPLFAVFSGHSRGKKGFCHDKQHWKGVFCVHCGELLFFTEGRRAQLMALAAMKGLRASFAEPVAFILHMLSSQG